MRQSELTTLLSFVLSFGPSGAIIVKYFYYMLPTFIRNNTYPDGSLDACDRALIMAPILWLAATILLDYFRNRIVAKNVFLNDVIDKESGTIRKRNDLFKESVSEQNKNDQIRSLVKNDTISTDTEINGLNEQIVLATQNHSDLPIQASRISKIFKNNTSTFYALKDISIVLDKNETLGLLGPNGAGKSTLFNILSTYYDCSAGQIRTFGEELSSYSSFFSECGLCAQDNILWDNLSVNAQLNVMRILRGVPFKPVYMWLEALEMSRFVRNQPSGLSSGM